MPIIVVGNTYLYKAFSVFFAPGVKINESLTLRIRAETNLHLAKFNLLHDKRGCCGKPLS